MKKLKTLLLALVVLLLAGNLSAQLSPLPLWFKSGAADLVVTGVIVKVEENTFDLVVDHHVLGAEKSDRLTVKQFQGEGRWEEYEIGQRVLLFLTGGENDWTIMGENGEGEYLIFQGIVYMDERAGGLWGDFQTSQLNGKEIKAEMIYLGDAIEGIAEFRKCFTVIDRSAEGQGPKVKQTCPDKELKKKRFHSDVLDKMCFQILEYFENR